MFPLSPRLAVAAATLLAGAAFAEDPIALHPGNPHYFLWRGQPTVLLTSGEHYGAVLNRDFDFSRHLQTLASDRLNYTRIFSGAYVEPEGAFNIARNTLAPDGARFLAPWARSDQPGYAGGGNRFDLNRWNPEYFDRLKAFVREASRQGVVVELTLFCPMYEELQWRVSPMNAENNVNGLGTVARTNVYTLDRHGGLLAVQETLTRKLVSELNEFDNLIFEICNEPYFGGVTLPWQQHIAKLITDTERALPQRHLIAQNIANNSATISEPFAEVSIFNFHYATPPDTVAMNYGLRRVIGDDETGFRGTNDLAYRSEAWEFLLAGGGLYNNLDYSFTVGHEDGTFVYPDTQPGGGNPAFRKQLRILGEFFRSLDFIHMAPDNSVLRGGLPDGVSARALVLPGRDIAVYLRMPEKAAAPRGMTLQIELAEGDWEVTWLNPVTGTSTSARVKGGGVTSLPVPAFEADLALRVRKSG
ncbi:MAG: hypothetical protein KIT22_06915 [Verrucomicrobiae bacterium]|nr:hypothetical protein [Verrucomicrobiae bacterium]